MTVFRYSLHFVYLGVLGFCSLPDFVKKRLKRGKIGFPVYLHCRGCFSLISGFEGGWLGICFALALSSFGEAVGWLDWLGGGRQASLRGLYS